MATTERKTRNMNISDTGNEVFMREVEVREHFFFFHSHCTCTRTVKVHESISITYKCNYLSKKLVMMQTK